jgi:hypothetical protein
MYGPVDERTGWSKDVTPDLPRFPLPVASTDEVAARQTAKAEQRIREGRTTPSVWDQTADQKRRAMLKASGRRAGRGAGSS